MTPRSNKNERGAILVTAILVLALLGVLALGVTLATNSDMLINGYYRNYGGSFYAADSGVSIARQQLINRVLAAVPSTFTAGTAPIPAGTDTSVQTYITTNYGSFTSLATGNAARSWPSQFKISSATFALLTNPTQPVVTATDSHGAATGYQYTYTYALTAVGQSSGSEQATVTDSGSITLNATITPASAAIQSFAAWGMFIDQQPICSGSSLVAGTITGPVFTNGAWTFGTGGAYVFTDNVGSVTNKLGYQFSSSCVQSNASNYTSGGTQIKPTFQNGVTLGMNSVPLPSNDFSQKRAALDGLGTNTATVSRADLTAALKDVNGAVYPASGTATGVYMGYSGTSVSGGGIYVEGDCTVTLSTSGASAEVYTIKQGSTTTTITIDPTANSTTIVSGTHTKTLTGVPQNKVTTPVAATMLYVNGNITALKGPAQGQAAINDGIGLTITASADVTITGDILYKTEPVTLTQNQIAGTPAGTLISANNSGQTLGIFTATGDIHLNNAQSNGNLQIDASMATISASGSGGLDNPGSAINTLTIVGGRIQNTIQNINTTTRNLYFDRRNSTGFGPPWFPNTTVTPANTSTASFVSSVQRVQWYNTIQ